MHWLPKMSVPREMSSGSAMAAVFTETLSAPDCSSVRISVVEANAAANGEGNEHLIGGAFDNIDAPFHGRAPTRCDVEKDELVGAFVVLERGELDGKHASRRFTNSMVLNRPAHRTMLRQGMILRVSRETAVA